MQQDTLISRVHYAMNVCRGRVVSKECIDKIVKMDMRDPISGEKLSEDDIIYLQRVLVHAVT